MSELLRKLGCFETYDVTMRDGGQDPEVRFSVGKKLTLLRMLDEFGVDRIEGGWPGANEIDTEFFSKTEGISGRDKLVAFGKTIKGIKPEDDEGLNGLLRADTSIVTLVGKTWKQHVIRALEIDPEENVANIFESVKFMHSKGREVFFDPEHWFDGYRQDPDYALACLEAALAGGATLLALCDTRGAASDRFISKAVEVAISRFPYAKFGIHVHNDGELGVINTIRALEKGVVQVQGSVNGYGERVGNLNWCSFLPTAQFKYDMETGFDLTQLTPLAHAVAKITEVPVALDAPYVGYYAFTHKAGLHASGQERDPEGYEHIRPEWVGNKRRYFHSEQGGSTNLDIMLETHGFELPRTDDRFKLLVEKMKRYRCFGDAQEFLFLYENLIRGEMPFTILDGSGTESKRGQKLRADVAVKVNGDIYHEKSTGDGPINAYDRALRKALSEEYPEVNEVKLLDYEILKQNGDQSSASEVEARLLVSFEGKEITSRVRGTDQDRVGEDAFADIYKYCILKQRTR